VGLAETANDPDGGNAAGGGWGGSGGSAARVSRAVQR